MVKEKIKTPRNQVDLRGLKTSSDTKHSHGRSTAAHRPSKQADQEKYEENHEEDLGHESRGASNGPEPENCGHDCNDQKENRPG